MNTKFLSILATSLLLTLSLSASVFAQTAETETETTTTTETTTETTTDEAVQTAAPTTETEAETTTTTTATPSAYELEIAKVLSEKLVTENPTVEANKCEVLQIMARKFNWQLSTVTETSFTDVPGWCSTLTNTARETGVVKGRTETTLGLDTPVTRYEVATMLYRELKRQNYTFTGATTVQFSDTAPDWATEAVSALSKEQIVKGFEDGSFGGDKGILKQDLGVMLLRLKLAGPLVDTTPPVADPNNTSSFVDSALVGSWTWLKTTQGVDLVREASDSDIPFILKIGSNNILDVEGDCNRISGKFTQKSAGNIEVGTILMTRMLCDGSIENGFVTTLQKASTYTLTPDTLTIYTTGTTEVGNRTMVFTKKEAETTTTPTEDETSS